MSRPRIGWVRMPDLVRHAGMVTILPCTMIQGEVERGEFMSDG